MEIVEEKVTTQVFPGLGLEAKFLMYIFCFLTRYSVDVQSVHPSKICYGYLTLTQDIRFFKIFCSCVVDISLCDVINVEVIVNNHFNVWLIHYLTSPPQFLLWPGETPCCRLAPHWACSDTSHRPRWPWTRWRCWSDSGWTAGTPATRRGCWGEGTPGEQSNGTLQSHAHTNTNMSMYVKTYALQTAHRGR